MKHESYEAYQEIKQKKFGASFGRQPQQALKQAIQLVRHKTAKEVKNGNVSMESTLAVIIGAFQQQ